MNKTAEQCKTFVCRLVAARGEAMEIASSMVDSGMITVFYGAGNNFTKILNDIQYYSSGFFNPFVDRGS